MLLDEKAYDEGLKVLAADMPEAFAALAADRKGDLLFALNKIDEARSAYQTALDKTDAKNPARQLIQLKLANMEVARMNVRNMLFRIIEAQQSGVQISLAEA